MHGEAITGLGPDQLVELISYIDEVVEWSAERIVCSSGGHRASDHPLRSHGRLGIACGIELAAQTMAVHGAILAEGSADRPRAGLHAPSPARSAGSRT